MSVQILIGNCVETLRGLPEKSVNCCVTSPPYFGLRSYLPDGHDSKHLEIGLEETPEQFIAKLVEVFREVRRVLRDDGTAWVNMGDSYARTGGTARKVSATAKAGGTRSSMEQMSDRTSNAAAMGLKEKDLIGVPWALAKALRDPYYAGTIKSELDRVWLAAMMDGEGTISGFYHDRPNGEGVRTGVNVCLTNTCFLILNRAAAIWPASLLPHEQNNDRLGNKPVFRWKPSGAENTGDFLAELYPYLMTKKRQAMLAWNLMQFSKDGQKWGKSAQAEEVRGKRAELVRLMTGLNQGESVIIPEWVKEPPSLYEPGWYLRQDIIWSKPNPMPESVTDRCTKAHEYIFLLSKGPRYYCDMGAIKEPAQEWSGRAGTFDRSGNDVAEHILPGQAAAQHRPRPSVPKGGFGGKTADAAQPAFRAVTPDRNKRSVWTVATKPYAGAHFATFPTELIEPCILAGCPVGGTVLDPFGGAGTTGLVADRHQRNAILCELNSSYAELARQRVSGDAPLFAEVTAT